MSTHGSSMRRIGCGCCVRPRGMLGERKSLKTLQKQTLQSSMAYSDALTMKLLEIQPTRLLLNVTGLAMLTVCPSHSPPPNPNTVHHVQVYFSAYCSIGTPAFLIQNTVYVNEGFTTLIHCVCPLKRT